MARVLAGDGKRNRAASAFNLAQQNAAAFLRITSLGLPADQVVIRLADLQHEALLGKWRQDFQPARKSSGLVPRTGAFDEGVQC